MFKACDFVLVGGEKNKNKTTIYNVP